MHKYKAFDSDFDLNELGLEAKYCFCSPLVKLCPVTQVCDLKSVLSSRARQSSAFQRIAH